MIVIIVFFFFIVQLVTGDILRSLPVLHGFNPTFTIKDVLSSLTKLLIQKGCAAVGPQSNPRCDAPVLM